MSKSIHSSSAHIKSVEYLDLIEDLGSNTPPGCLWMLLDDVVTEDPILNIVLRRGEGCRDCVYRLYTEPFGP